MPLNNKSDFTTTVPSWLVKTLVTILLTSTLAWASYVSSRINEITGIESDISWIKKTIGEIHDDIHQDYHAQRHNP
jgi:hypothetical protein